MIRISRAIPLLALPAALTAQQTETPLLVAPAAEGVVLRWVWPEGERPVGYHVERREFGGAWSRLTARPIARIRAREAARQRLGAVYERYEGMLFPEDPFEELRDPASYRSLLLLVADLEPAVAEVLGLRFDDRGAERGRIFEYRLLALTREGEREAARGGPVVAGSWEQPDGPDSLEAAQATDGVVLRWSAAGPFTAYHVDRRRGAGPWERASGVPVVIFSNDGAAATAAAPRFFRDSTARPGDSLVYAVSGVDPFGRFSLRSAEARIVVRDVQPPAPPRQVMTAVRGDTVTISWVPSLDPEVTAYRVWRGAGREGPFEPVGGPERPGDTLVFDAGRPEGSVTWYHVTATDRSGNESPPSFSAMAVVPDVTAPAAPDSLRAVADTGFITLAWQPVASRDLRGYRVYRSTVPDGTFGLITAHPLPVPALVDSIPRGVDHAFFYRVTAVDSAFNESSPSPVLAARPPDARPPTAPRIEWVRPAEDGLVVRWFANPDPDVEHYLVRYRRRGEGVWLDRPREHRAPALVDTIPGLEARRLYDVVVIAVDDAGNASEPSPVVVGEPVHRRPPAPLDARRARYDERIRAVVIEWNPRAGLARVRVERRDAATGLVQLIADVPGESGRVVDRLAAAGRRYEYALRAVDRFGNIAEPGARRRAEVPEETP
jgi:uncharacterized protein